MYFLAIETSCDETAAAVFTEEPRVLSSVVASQDELHRKFGGVVPEIAARAHLERMLPIVDSAISRAGIQLHDIGAIAVHNTPGLVGALLVGVTAAKSLAIALNVPLLSVNHVHAHIYACRLAADRDIFPCVGLVISGGHTVLFDCQSALDFQLLGSTRDDATGEAFDKVAATLKLGFPGGPAVEREAKQGDPEKCRFPRTLLEPTSLDFSFSGLKTAVLYAAYGHDLEHPKELSPQRRADIAAGFQHTVAEVLAEKCRRALTMTGRTRLAVGGGVSANTAIRSRLDAMCKDRGADLNIPPINLCTDNAAMAALAVEKWKRGDFAPLDLDAIPSLG